MRTTSVARGLQLCAAVICAASLLGGVASAATTGATPKDPRMGLVGTRPLAFEPNQGQAAEPTRFLARGNDFTLWLSPTATSMSLRRDGRIASVNLKLVGANPAAQLVGLDKQKGVSNYYVGERSQWQERVPHFGRVAYSDVYPGVNLVHYGNEGVLEYDFVVAPGADASVIRFEIEGASKIALRKNGDLLLKLATGEIVHRAPVVYQERNGVKTPVDGRFVIEHGNQVRFELGAHDRTLALVIDPLLSFSTYLGGTGADSGLGIALDSTGSAYVVGQTASTNFPTTLPGSRKGTTDAYVTRYDWDGQSILFSTYLGGTGVDHANAIAVDQNDGAAWVTGVTRSTNFPTAGTPLQAVRPGPTASDDGFVAKLDAFGTLLYGSYLGGSASDIPHGIAVDQAGDAFIAGETTSANFPTSVGAYDTIFGGGGAQDIFVTRLDTNGQTVYSTYIGGPAGDQGFAVSADAGNAYVAGRSGSTNYPVTPNAYQPVKKGVQDAVVTFLDGSGYPTYSTYLGGSGDDRALGIAANLGTGNAFITGSTASANFPTRSAFQKTRAGGTDAFVAKIISGAATPSATLAYSTYLGGSGSDVPGGIAVGENGFAYVVGTTSSTNFPTVNAPRPNLTGASDAFVSRIDPSGQVLRYSSYLGGSAADAGNAVAVSKGSFEAGQLMVTGTTNSTDFPTDSALQPAKAGAAASTDAFVMRVPFLSLDDPFSTSKWAVGAPREVRWTTSLDPSELLSIELFDGGSLVYNTFVLAGWGSTNFFVPAFATAAPDNAELVITWIANPNFHSSSGLFDVGAPSITVKAPKAGNCWEVGEARAITWSHNLGGFESFTIELDRDGDTTFEEVIASGVQGSGDVTYDWPAVTAGTDSVNARIRVTSTAFVSTSGTSAAFKIVGTCNP